MEQFLVSAMHKSSRAESRSIPRTTAILCAFLAAGCEASHYKLEMSVDGSALDRKLTCWRQSGGDEDRQLRPMPEPELQRIAHAYGVDVPATGEREFEFSGRFEGTTPDDVGGAGALTMWTSDLGRSWAYVERFRGNDDLAAMEDQRRAALNDLLGLLTDWLHTELGDGAEFEQVHMFLNETLRHDLENAAEYSSLAADMQDLSGDSEHAFEIGLRVAQYAAERGYFDLQDVPSALLSAENGDATLTLGLVRSILAAKLGHELADEWDFLGTPDRLSESLNRSLQQHPLYVEFVRQRAKQNPMNAPPTPTELIATLAFSASGMHWGGFDGLDVTLNVPAEPYRTNGVWSPDELQVVWNRRLQGISDEREDMPGEPQQSLPSLLFAFWSLPDADLQTARFGRVILRDQALAEYCQWHADLTPQQREQWTLLIAALKPGPGAAEWIENFHFTPGSEADEQIAQRGRLLLLTGLNAE